MKDTSYVSEATEFINSMLNQPEIQAKQMQLRRTWWHNDNNDNNGFLDLDQQQEFAQASLKSDAYTYFTYHK